MALSMSYQYSADLGDVHNELTSKKVYQALLIVRLRFKGHHKKKY